jgi:hypothetical protein
MSTETDTTETGASATGAEATGPSAADAPATDATRAHNAAPRGPAAALAGEAWLASDDAALPPLRPRRRLTPLTGGLSAVLLVACGFIGGVLVQKDAGASSDGGRAGGDFAALANALRGAQGGAGAGGAQAGAGGGQAGAGGGQAGAGGGQARAGGAAGGGASAARGGFGGGAFGGASGATVGQVTTVSGNTLYVTDAQGNTVKVKAAPGATVTRTVDAKPHQIHPGEQVVVRGTTRNGTVTATSITAGASGAGAALGVGAFGGGFAGAGGGQGASGTRSARGQLDQLFGPSNGSTR